MGPPPTDPIRSHMSSRALRHPLRGPGRVVRFTHETTNLARPLCARVGWSQPAGHTAKQTDQPSSTMPLSSRAAACGMTYWTVGTRDDAGGAGGTPLECASGCAASGWGGGDIASVVDEGGGEEDLISLLLWEVRDC